MQGNMASQHRSQLQSDGLINGGPQSIDQGSMQSKEAVHHQHEQGRCSLLGPTNGGRCDNSLYDRRLSCFGCGIGWFCFILGFALPLLWYIATALYLAKYHLRDPRERAGLAASAIAALICSVAALIALIIVEF